MCKPSQVPKLKSFTGSRLRSRRRSELRSATGWRTTRASVSEAARSYSERRSPTCRPLLLDQNPRVFLFWTAFILTRPLGATVGDFLDKPLSHGGLALNRYYASAVLLAAIVSLVLIIPQRAGMHPNNEAAAVT